MGTTFDGKRFDVSRPETGKPPPEPRARRRGSIPAPSVGSSSTPRRSSSAFPDLLDGLTNPASPTGQMIYYNFMNN